jgi:outer membrane protein assembly factor BamB
LKIKRNIIAILLVCAIQVQAQDSWPTIFHDQQRTSASRDGQIQELQEVWSFTAPAMTQAVVATPNAIFTHYSQRLDYGKIARLSTSGAVVWTATVGYNCDRGNWPALWGNRVVVNADYLSTFDQSTGGGKVTMPTGCDVWGEILPDGQQFYTVNDAGWDCVGQPWLAAYGTSQLWRTMTFAAHGQVDFLKGALALDGDVLFRAVRHFQTVCGWVSGPAIPVDETTNGLYAFNKNTGQQLWMRTAKIDNPISVGLFIFCIEDDNDVSMDCGTKLITWPRSNTRLVARGKATGTVIWQQPIPGNSLYYQAPVIANGQVIVASSEGIHIFDEVSGSPMRTIPLQGMGYYSDETTDVGRVLETLTWHLGTPTFMAVALQSNTLVVTAGDGIHVYSLVDGHEIWWGWASVSAGNRPMNPVIVGNMLYVSEFSVDLLNSISSNRLIALRSGLELPPAASYSCVNYVCIDPNNGTGAYQTLAECQVACQPPPPDITVPIVTISCPSILPSRGNVVISVSSNEKANISIEFDGTVIASCIQVTACSKTLNVKKISRGSHTVRGTATDLAGNVSTKTLIVTK